ncbi:MAG: hypothetical protein V1660_03720 [archaeon]
MKAQISFEYLLMVGLIILLLGPVFYYSFSTSVQTIKMNEADNLVKSVANTADTLYSLGIGSQDTIQVKVPGGVRNITISGKEIVLTLSIFNGNSQISQETKGNITGSIPIKEGTYHVTIKNENNTIQVTG